MQPITRISANNPVLWSHMNSRFDEIEARDNEQETKINVLLSKVNSNVLTLEQINNRKILCGFYSISPETASTILGITTLYAHNVIVFPYTSGNGFPSMIISSTSKNGGTYIRHLDGDTSAWVVREIATTTKTTITFLNGWTKVPNFKCEITKSGKILSVNALISNSAPNTLPIFNIGTSISEGVIKFAQNNEKQNIEIRVGTNGDVSFYATPAQSAWYTLDFSINL